MFLEVIFQRKTLAYFKSSILRKVAVAGDAALRCVTNGLNVVRGADAAGKIPGS